MNIMDNLNKENFFDAMSDKYPKAMEHFCRWVDAYKLQVGWNTLFNSNSDYQDYKGKNAPAPKFHDLPYEMQFGILIKYCTETFAEEGNWINLNEMRELFESCLIEINQ